MPVALPILGALGRPALKKAFRCAQLRRAFTALCIHGLSHRFGFAGQRMQGPDTTMLLGGSLQLQVGTNSLWLHRKITIKTTT
jgi:hypothetical protein